LTHAVSWRTSRTGVSADEFLNYLRLRAAGEGVTTNREIEELTPSRRNPNLFIIANDVLPAITQALTDDRGRLWIRRFDPLVWPDGLSPLWDVFCYDATYATSYSVPLAGVFQVRDLGILGTTMSGDGLEALAVAKIPQHDYDSLCA
jgi:hypothetical protein